MEYRSDDIQTLEGLKHIRAFPGMYIKSPDEMESQVQLAKEIIDNAKDEVVAISNQGREGKLDVIVFHNAKTYQICVIDQGRGIPVDKLQQVFTVPNTSGKWKDAYVASTGIYGVGSKATVALSDRFIAITNRPEGSAMIDVRDGEVTHSKIDKPLTGKYSHNGTVIIYQPNSKILADVDKFMDTGFPEVLKLLEFVSVFEPTVGIEVRTCNKLYNWSAIPDAQKLWDTLHQHDRQQLVFDTSMRLDAEKFVRKLFNINSHIAWKMPTLTKPLDFKKTSDLIGFDIDLFLVKDFKHQTGLLGAVNMTIINDPTSFHMEGLMAYLKTMLIEYIVDDDVVSFFKQLYKLPLSGSVIVSYKGASFVGQTKDAFKDREFLRHYQIMLNLIGQPKDSQVWSDLYDLLEDDIKEKYVRYQTRDMVSSKGLKNIYLQLCNAGSYVGCKSNDSRITELFLTEGDSAGGAVSQVRDPKIQAVFKLSGKPINATKANQQKFDSNDLMKDLIKILGVTPYDKDLSKCNFGKIGILTDADSDGYHITALLVGNLHKINPLLLSEGRVFLANPPLYTMAVRNKMLFLRDRKALMDTKIETVYQATFSIAVNPNNTPNIIPITGDAFREFCYLIDRVGEIVTSTAKNLSIDSLVIERLVGCVDHLANRNVEGIKDHLGVDGAFFNGDTLILIMGGLEMIVPTIGLVDMIKSFILPELRLASWDKYIPLFTTLGDNTHIHTPMTLVQIYQIMQELDSLVTVSRYKGLGSLKLEDLESTCVNPLTRCYVHITSPGDIDHIYNLLGVNTQSRKRISNLQE